MPRRALVLTAAISALAISGCGIGKSNETQHEVASIQGSDTTYGLLQFDDFYITAVGQSVPDNAPTGIAASNAPAVSPSAVPTPTFAKGAIEGYLVGTVNNDSPKAASAIVGVTLAGATVSPLPASAKLTVPALGALKFQDPAAFGKGPFLAITGDASPLTIGTTVQVQFSLADGTQTPVINVPIVTSDVGSPPPSPLSG